DGSLYDRRLQAGRALARKQAVLEEQRVKLAAMGPEAEDDASATQLLDQIAALDRQRDAWRAANNEVFDAERNLSDGQGLLATLKTEYADAAKEVEALEKKFAKRREDCAKLAARIDNG